MTVALKGGTIFLERHCAPGEAEELLQLLLAAPSADIDWRACEGAHTAVVQVLLAARRPLLGPPLNATLQSIGRALGPAE
jgi:hypothetical protein